MEGTLKSILRRIHWSSAVKAFVFALAWLWLPSWVFVLISFGAYFIPFFRAGKLLIPFLTLLVLGLLQPPSLLFAAIFGLILYIILLIKDLLLIDRRSAHELVTLALAFLLLRAFYIHFNQGISGGAFLVAFLTSILLALLTRGIMVLPDEGITTKDNVVRIATWLSALLFMEIMVMGLFLPLDFVYQSVIVFLVATIVIDLVPQYLAATLTRTKALTTATVLFALLVIVISSARWGL